MRGRNETNKKMRIILKKIKKIGLGGRYWGSLYPTKIYFSLFRTIVPLSLLNSSSLSGQEMCYC